MRTVYAFDLDDTLYREMEYVHSGYRAVARALACNTGADADALFRIISTNRPLGFEAALGAVEGMPGADRFSVASMVAFYRAHEPDIRLFQGAGATLRRLKEAGAVLVLITDGSTRHQRAKIRALGLDCFFAPDDILISGETGGDKTTVIPWALVERKYSPCRRIYVGDNLSKDFHIPNLRGWHTVMLRDRAGENVFPQHPSGWPSEYRPRTIVDSLVELPSL